MPTDIYCQPDYCISQWSGPDFCCSGDYNTKCESKFRQPQDMKIVDNGQSGHFTIKNKRNFFLCNLEFGQECTDGVNVQVKELNVPNG